MDDAAVARVLRDNVPNPATRDTYLARLASLRKLLGAPDVASVIVEGDPKHRMIPKLKRTVKGGVRSVLTVKNMVGAVLATHKHLPLSSSEARAAWTAYHRELCDAVDAAYARNRPINERQEANYVGIDEVQARFDELRQRPIGSLRESMAVLLMGVYAHLTPKRSDYGTLHAYPDDAAAARVPRGVLNRQNYVILDRRAPRLVMHRYKTADKYAEVVEPIPKPLAVEMRRSLKAWPRGHVFVGRGDGLKPLSNNLFTKYVIRTFAAHFDGRAAGTSLLRHAYVSERVDFNRLSMAERRAVARLMGHTTGTQETVYKWVDRRTHAL